MPSAMSNYLEPLLLDLVLRGQSFSPPAAVYAALLTTFTPSADGDTFTEVAGDGYERQPATFATPYNGATANTSLLRFVEAQEAWGDVTHMAVFDAATGGHMLFWSALAAPLTVQSEDTVRIAVGQLTIAMGGAISAWLADALLRHVLRGQAFTPPASVHVGLLTDYANDDDFTEVAGGAYARRSVTFAESLNGDAASTNDSAATFPQATAAWGVITHAAIFDTATHGHLLWRGPLTSPRTINPGRIIELPVGDLTIRFD